MYLHYVLLSFLFQNIIRKALFSPVGQIKENVSELKFLSAEDKCANFDPEKEKLREQKRFLQIAEKNLMAKGERTKGIGNAMPKILWWDTGAAMKYLGAEMIAEGAALGAQALAIDVESQELEYMKCAKADFDQLKNEFNESREEFKQFQQKFDEFQKQFNEFQEQFKQFRGYVAQEFTKVHQELAEIKTKVDEAIAAIKVLTKIIVWTPYNNIQTSIQTMNEKFDISKNFIKEESDQSLLSQCEIHDMHHMLNALIKFVFHDMFIVDIPYQNLRVMAQGFFKDIKEMGKLAIACVTVKYKSLHEKQIHEYYKEKIAPKIKELLEIITKKLSESRAQELDKIKEKSDNITRDSPVQSKDTFNIMIEEYISKNEEWATAAHLWRSYHTLVTSGNVISLGNELNKISSILDRLDLSEFQKSCIREVDLYYTHDSHVFWCEKFDYLQQETEAKKFLELFLEKLNGIKKDLNSICVKRRLERLISIFFSIQDFLYAAYAEAPIKPWKAIIVGNAVEIAGHEPETSNIVEISIDVCNEKNLINVCF